MLMTLGTCNGNASEAARLYRERFPLRRQPERRVIQRIERSLRESVLLKRLVPIKAVQGRDEHHNSRRKFWRRWRTTPTLVLAVSLLVSGSRAV